ncbi:MAG: 16S rRNA (adenine(1518)-N(6)/adenine(1519)-N(6))-dimethyltransferase RsmA [Candidatus Aenigmatarchaeota archaeon]
MPAKLGQHFLQDIGTARKIVEYADVGSRDTVLEIGPGKGMLTEQLVKKAKKVIAIEKDSVLARVIADNFPDVAVIRADALKIEWPEFDKIVSNLPYQISSPVTFKLFRHKWKAAVLMYQKEFGERFVAEPGERRYSRLTVAVNYHCDAEVLEFVPKEKFRPRPKVDSVIIRLTPKKPPFVADDFFWHVVTQLFRHKKKTVAAALKASKYSKKAIERLPEELAKERVFWCDLKKLKSIADAMR